MGNVLHGYARLTKCGLALSLVPLEPLEAAARGLARLMKPQEVSNSLWAYATLGERPGDATFAALGTRAEDVARSMNSQEVANALWSYATLGEAPARATLDALEAAAVRTARSMKPQDVANSLWSYAVFDLRPPRAVVDAAAPLADRFITKDLAQCFHAHLAEAASGRRLDLPEGLFERAEEAWRDLVDDTTSSSFHRQVAASLRRLGVEHTVEGATDDRLFRVDCLLADGRTAVEADGWTPVCIPRRASRQLYTGPRTSLDGRRTARRG